MKDQKDSETKGQGKGFRKGVGKRSFWLDNVPTAYTDYYGGSYLLNKKETTTQDIAMDLAGVPTFRINSPEKEELLQGRRVRFSDAEYEEKVVKKLNFPEFNAAMVNNFHMVRGQRICGLLVDPGISSGLIGTDTLKEPLEAGMVPEARQDEMSWGPSTTTVTGISGQADDTLPRISIPFDIGKGWQRDRRVHGRPNWWIGLTLSCIAAQHKPATDESHRDDSVVRQR